MSDDTKKDDIDVALDRLEQSMNKTYTVKCHCTNCDKGANITVRWGKPFDTRREECPKCGCATLRKVGVV
jgi:hypothetical protein